MPKIAIDRNSCIQCGACADICYARDVFEMKENGPVVVHPEICRLCGHCVAVCPTDSIDHEKILLQDCPLIDPQQLPSIDVMITALRARRSYRRYQDRTVPREMIRDLISHSRWIPTGYNRQFLDWIVLDDEQSITKLLQSALREVRHSIEHGRDASKFLGGLSVEDIDRLIEQAVQKKKRFFFNAPVVLAGYCEKDSVCAREEATYAAYNITLAAERMGLGTCHIGSIHLILEEFPHLQHEVLGIPEEKELQVLLTLGYPAWHFRRMVPRRLPNIKWNP
jgi:nitroreductase/NAD-dependent dihydropyrimidine dehydrogenase PreA subunit